MEGLTLSTNAEAGNSGSQSNKTNPLPVFYNPNAIMGQTYLTKENYVNWSGLFKTMLRTHKLLFVIDPTPPAETLPDGNKNPLHELWFSATDLVCGWIKGTVTPAVLPYLNSSNTAPKAWEVLAKRFGATSALQIENLKDKLHGLKKESKTSVSDYLLSATNIADALTAAGEPVDEKELIQRVLGGLGQEYKEFLTSTATSNLHQTLTVDDLTELLIKEETLQNKFSVPQHQSVAFAAEKPSPTEPSSVDSQANYATNRGNGGNNNRGGGRHRGGGRGNNNYNGGRGNNWRARGRGQGRGRGSYNHGQGSSGRGILPTPYNPGSFPNMLHSDVTCQLCFKHGHSAQTCNQRFNAAYVAQTEPYILDSGATNHMTSNPSTFHDYSPYSGQSDTGDSYFWQ